MPWVKGQSGNPRGAGAPNVRALARKYTGRAIRTLAYICGDGAGLDEHGQPDPKKMGTDDPKARVAAAKALLDRGYGPADAPVLTEIPDDELRAEVTRRANLERAGGIVESTTEAH